MISLITAVKKRGRKRKYGERLKKLPELALDMEKQIGQFMIYGKIRECEYAEFECMHKKFKKRVKVVLVYMKNRVFPILSTDTTLSAQEMIENYSARWKIESGFKELKHEIGALDNQARKQESRRIASSCLALPCLAPQYWHLLTGRKVSGPAADL